MSKKVILISVDGMRPDGFMSCKNPYIETMMKEGSYTLTAKTVLPSVTLPCHMSLFHSVPPERHGITTNTYMPMVRPLNGLFEQLSQVGKKKCAFYYGWEPIRDVARPLSCTKTEYIHALGYDATDDYLTDRALEFIGKAKPDFVFLYMVETDEKGGHKAGWMSETYLEVIANAVKNIQRVREACGDEYTIIITADHGGHDRTHGTARPEDTTIPMFFFGEDFEAGKDLGEISILDITPTICDVMEVDKAMEWEGTSLLEKAE